MRVTRTAPGNASWSLCSAEHYGVDAKMTVSGCRAIELMMRPCANSSTHRDFRGYPIDSVSPRRGRATRLVRACTACRPAIKDLKMPGTPRRLCAMTGPRTIQEQRVHHRPDCWHAATRALAGRNELMLNRRKLSALFRDEPQVVETPAAVLRCTWLLSRRPLQKLLPSTECPFRAYGV